MNKPFIILSVVIYILFSVTVSSYFTFSSLEKRINNDIKEAKEAKEDFKKQMDNYIIKFNNIFGSNAILIYATIDKYFNDNDVDKMFMIAWCESKLNINAVSNTSDYGVAQINWVNWNDESIEEKLNLDNNIRKAYDVYMRQGWNAWISSKKCWSK